MRAVWVLCLVACSANSPPRAAPPESEAARPMEMDQPRAAEEDQAEQPVAFPLPAIAPYFSVGQAHEALLRYRRQELEQAAAAASAAGADATDASEKWRLGVFLAIVERDRGNWQAAAELFVAAASTPSAIADFLHFQAARALARSGDARAATHASQVKASSPWASDSAFLLAEAARAAGDNQGAVQGYRIYLDSKPGNPLRDEALFRLGESQRALGQRDEARATWRHLVVSSPVSTWVGNVRAIEADVDAALTSSERLERGMAYFDAMRNIDSESDFAAVVDDPETSSEQRCQALFHRAKSVYKERQYARSAPLFEPAIVACKASGNTNYEVKSAYQAGLAYGRAKQLEKGASFHAYVEQYKEHSYADDARLRQAELYDELGDQKKVTELLSTLPELYPEGDMRSVALWRLARHAYQEGNYQQAETWLRKQIDLVPVEINWWAEGQAYYWLARTLGHLHKAEEAASAYEDCVRKYPLTYYSMLALNRLRESWPDRFASLSAEIAKDESGTSLQLRDRPVYGSAAFASALELARLGLAPEARRELAALGFTPPAGRDPQVDADKLDWLLASQLLLDLAGDYEQSHWIGRWHSIEYRRHWPSGVGAKLWRLAYPLAYWDLVQEFAGKYSYPAALQMAIVREESAFDPARESYANAIGLTQMIFPTARDHTADSGIEVTRENLQHPVKNVTIGSHFLQSLQEAFEGRVGLMVPGYNAGRARVRSWIRSRHKYDLDEFVERIKDDQARRYTKRVLGSYFAYSYLADRSIPVVSNQVPRKLGKK